MVTWKILFNLGSGKEENIELFDVATLVDWDPEFKGKYIAGFFNTDYAWTGGLQAIIRDGESFPIKNFFMVVARQWGDSKTKGVPLGVLFEFTEGDLKLRGVGPQSIYEKAGGDSNLLLNLVENLFEKPDIWRTKIVISAKTKSDWKAISDIIGAEPWLLVDQGRKIMNTDPRKAIENFNKAYRVFEILADINGQFHALYALTELILDTQNTDQARQHIMTLWDLATQLGDPMLEENVLSIEGIIAYEDNIIDQAITKFEQALKRAIRANIHKAVVNAYCNIGQCYYRIGKLTEALTHFDKARSLSAERNDKKDLVIAEIYLAKTLGRFLKQGDLSSGDQARYYLNESIQLSKQINFDMGLMQANGVFGDLEALEENYEAALLYFEKAAELAQTLKEYKIYEYYYQKAQKMREYLLGQI